MSKSNKLPDFGDSANLDEAIIKNTSTLKTTGFQPNTIIESAQVNTYMKMLVNALNGLTEVLAGDVLNIEANAEQADWIVAFKQSLQNYIANSTALKATNVDIINNVSDSSTIDFSIGTGHYSKTIKQVKLAQTANELAVNAGDESIPIFFTGGLPTTVKSNKLKTSFSVSRNGNNTFQVKINSGTATIKSDDLSTSFVLSVVDDINKDYVVVFPLMTDFIYSSSDEKKYLSAMSIGANNVTYQIIISKTTNEQMFTDYNVTVRKRLAGSSSTEWLIVSGYLYCQKFY